MKRIFSITPVISTILILFLITACSKEDPAKLPVVTTSTVTDISTTGAKGGGIITSEGGSPINACGVCWGLTENPSVTGSLTNDTKDAGHFSSIINGLIPSTVYHVRAYATNSVGTGYGADSTFATAATIITDIEGNPYNTVLIGKQVWMTENLRTTKYNNGDVIATTIPSTKDIRSDDEPQFQWAYEGDESKVPVYGRIYTWYAANDSRKICPDGWHIPTYTEWTNLIEYLTDHGYGFQGSGSDIAKSMAASTDWAPFEVEGTIGYDLGSNNSSGLSFLPSGSRDYLGSFSSIGTGGGWWSSTQYNAVRAWYPFMYNNSTDLYLDYYLKITGFSVRCLRDK
jgi:uncharacterized protein (TIGR02145 family)